MGSGYIPDAALTVSLALVAGTLAQALAHHARIPGIVVLLAVGVILGPDLLNIVQPQSLGPALQTLVGYAVAVILFEGSMNLNFSRLRRESKTIRRLVTLGSLMTAVGAALSSKMIIGWEWRLALLFGTLVIVTGPTVISPLLRRIKITRRLHTILEAEGVLIDPIGAIVAIVTLEIVIGPPSTSLIHAALDILLKLGVGSLFGAIGGIVLALLLRPRRLIPAGLENVFTLSFVLALFHVGSLVQPESGIVAVTAAGLVVGNIGTRVQRELMEFKEQLTVMFIGMLFVLLAADVRLSEIKELGAAGILTVAAVMFVVRPLNVALSTMKSGISFRERAFLSWLAPRGLVAAGVASYFVVALEAANLPGGPTLRALVFLVIAATVTVQGLTGGFVASLLGVRKKTNSGYVILGANELGAALGRALEEGGEDVLLIDSNPDVVKTAESEGFRVTYGNALEEGTLLRAQVDSFAGGIGVTPNEEANLLFASLVHTEFKVSRAYAALHTNEGHVNPEMIRRSGATVLFGAQRDIDLWAVRIRRKIATLEWWRSVEDQRVDLSAPVPKRSPLGKALFPIVIKRNNQAFPVDDRTQVKKGDEICFVVFEELRHEARGWFGDAGWVFIRLSAPKNAKRAAGKQV